MFFCEKCRKKKGWPESIRGSHGRCEVCGKTADCHDVPSCALPVGADGLPKPKRKPKPKQKKLPPIGKVPPPQERWICKAEIPGGWVVWAIVDSEFVIQAHTDEPSDIIRLPGNNYDVAVAAYVKRLEQALQDVRKG